MKVTVNTKKKQFEPIELNITIESKEELNTWLSIFNGIHTPKFMEVVESVRSIYADGKLATLHNSEDAYKLILKAIR